MLKSNYAAWTFFGRDPGKGFCLLGMMLVFLTSCYFDEMEEALPPEGVISYSVDIQPIFSNNCTSCHPGQVANFDLTEGNSYDVLTNGVYIIPNDPEGSLLYQRLLGNPTVMPPSGSLQATELLLIQTWIEQGAANN